MDPWAAKRVPLKEEDKPLSEAGTMSVSSKQSGVTELKDPHE